MGSTRTKRTLQIKRVYEPAARSDGARILVDRLWPRGLSKEAAALTHWSKDVAPSTALRKWFGHDPERWTEFRRRYRAELDAKPAVLVALRELLGSGPATLVYGAHDTAHNQAVVLAELLAGVGRKAGKR